MLVSCSQEVRTALVFSNTRTLNIIELVSQVMEGLRSLQGDENQQKDLQQLKTATNPSVGGTMKGDVVIGAQMSGLSGRS